MNNEITESLLREIHHEYLSQRSRIILPKKQLGSRESETRFRASRLYGCPIADQYARMGMPVTHPHSYGLLQRFEQGNRVGEVWQEAVLWAAQQDKYSWISADYEVTLESDTLVGQADLVLNGIPVEIKNTVRYKPYAGHILQLMAYCKLIDAPYGYLVYQKEYNNLIFKVDAAHDVVNQAMAQIAEPMQPPQDVSEIRPGLCCEQSDINDVFPRVAARANSRTGVQKGDTVPGAITVRCQYFGHCFPWSAGHGNFSTVSTQEEMNAGQLPAVLPVVYLEKAE